MSSPLWRDLVPLAFGAVVDGVWCGTLAAVLTGSGDARYLVFATVVVFAAGVITSRGGDEARPRGRAARALAVALTLAAAAVLFVAGRSSSGEDALRWVVVDVAYSALLVVVGEGLGAAMASPRAAGRRAARGFVLLCVLLVAATLAGAPPAWATWAVAVTLLAGGLFVVAARARALAAVTPTSEQTSVWPWLLAVFGVTLAAVALGLVSSEVLRVDLIARALDAVAALIGYLLSWVGYVVGYAGGLVIRGAGWLLSLLDLHELKPVETPDQPGLPTALTSPEPQSGREGSVSRPVVIVALAALAIVASLSLVALALRRLRRVAPDEVAEEREAVASLRAVAAAGAGRLAGRLRRLVRRAPSKTPAELVRRRYAEFERRLGRAGQARAPGTTVRAFLLTVAAQLVAGTETDAALTMATIYERARYSSGGIDVEAAGTFARLARDLSAAATEG